MRRRGAVSLVKLKPRNLRALGRATALLAVLTFSLRRRVRNCSTLAITRLSLSKGARLPAVHVDVAVVGPRVRALRGPRTGSPDKARAAPFELLVQPVQHPANSSWIFCRIDRMRDPSFRLLSTVRAFAG
jgi:hypothetical protein